MNAKLTVALILAVLAGVAIADDAHFGKFMQWQRQHNKEYSSMDEFLQRFENFKASVTRVAERNARSGGRNNFGLNKFSDLSVDEFKANFLGYKPRTAKPTAPVMRPRIGVVADDLVDWRTKGAITPVKDQGQCGSCWAFSATEELESMWFLSGQELQQLSVEQTVDCDTVDQGCNGGDTISAYTYITGAGGVEGESDYPYTAGGGDSGTCQFDSSKTIAHMTNYSYATPPCTDSCTNQDEGTLASNLASQGPVSICVYAEPWQDYTGGVLSSDCESDYSSLDHCVQLVGYNKQDDNNYWIIRNSWATSWGEEGYIYVQIGSNLCGVADEATIIQI